MLAGELTFEYGTKEGEKPVIACPKEIKITKEHL